MLDPIPVSPSGHASPQFSERITSKSVDRIIETTSMREGRLRTDRRLMILRRTTQGTSSLNSVASWDSPVIGTDQVIMFSAWQKLSKEKQFLWTLISGGIVIGSVMKVGFFKIQKNILLEAGARDQRDGLKHLQEAKEFAEWSKKDREARLPKLTPEQREQMREYLKIVQQHGLTKGMEGAENNDCNGCPVLKQGKSFASSMTSD
ncbi:predicted protein [Phaeodactylum tricornutum CCAP 1055/1]|uniref:Uncharacterized protein n=1 Tax=Phaeodactylum tricornutum (strain CCAP 1055/1) TaxID=556484 RepID=B7GDR9_PHATC|nr:predicted protein [Phaeodactylum tricornutum CCAP 1055/1]EEC43309.1 predicted protein [Phaeodactylum tricornutum CCAP 1055/1]|eukprot:XP_002185177.1 predicted protein [Phaeodactylum tricornutum CCAP 1055/1]